MRKKGEKMSKYAINIVWSDEDQCFIATIPAFPGLSAHGDTPEEAAAESQIAMEGFIQVFEEDGCELPESQTLESFSGQLRLRLPKSLHADLSLEAKQEGVSLNSYMVYLLTKRHTMQKIKKETETPQIHPHVNQLSIIMEHWDKTLDIPAQNNALSGYFSPDPSDDIDYPEKKSGLH